LKTKKIHFQPPLIELLIVDKHFLHMRCPLTPVMRLLATPENRTPKSRNYAAFLENSYTLLLFSGFLSKAPTKTASQHKAYQPHKAS